MRGRSPNRLGHEIHFRSYDFPVSHSTPVPSCGSSYGARADKWWPTPALAN